MPAAKPRKRRSAEQTRNEILDAAEVCFATCGFEDTRLDDVAERVGVRRAALFYYFEDKRALYRATLGRLTADLLEQIRREHARPVPLPERIEDGLVTLVDFLAERPAFARLVLRLASDGELAHVDEARELAEPFVRTFEHLLAEGEREGLVRPVVRDPMLLVATLGGATVFHTAAMPSFAPEGHRSSDEAWRAEHRRGVRAVVRALLGLPGPEDAPGGATT